MLNHIVLGAVDIESSRIFYDRVLYCIGVASGVFDEFGRVYYESVIPLFIGLPINGEPATFANGGTIGFAAESVAQVKAWHAAGLANGGICAGAPGVRPTSGGDLYAALLRDPAGNKLSIIHRMATA